MSDVWKRCSTCKKEIGFRSTYYVCSVSTCTRKRTGFTFCSVECWESHLPMMRHREAGAVEETSPSREQWAAESAGDDGKGRGKTTAAAATPRAKDAPRRRVVTSSAPASAGAAPREVLVVVSRFKDYVKQRFAMNTSDGVFEALSDHLRSICHRAADNARGDGRKTILDRDFDFLRRS